MNRWAALGPTVGATAVLGYVEARTDLPTDGESGDLTADVALLALFGGAFALAVGIGTCRATVACAGRTPPSTPPTGPGA